jgi:hypothetical protein
MTAQGYIFMAIGWGLVLSLVIYAMGRLLRRTK